MSAAVIDHASKVQWVLFVSTLSDIQFMMLSPNSADDIELKLDENTTLRSEKSVKPLGVCIDNRLTLSDHISVCCLKAARQRNASTIISKYLDPKSKRIIYNIFIRSNFDYCPLVWHSCWETNDNKLEKVQERSLQIQWAIISRITKQNGSSTLLLHGIKLLLFGIHIFPWHECKIPS